MRFFAILALIVALGLGGCSKAGSLMSQANGSKQMHSKWKLLVSGFTGHRQAYDVELWVNGSKFRFQRAYKGANMSSGQEINQSDEVLYDGSDAYLFNPRSYIGATPPAGEKMSTHASKLSSPSAEALQLLTFWKVPDFPYDVTGPEKVDGHDCQVLVTTQLDIMRQEMKLKCFVDTADGIMRLRTEHSGADSKDALYGTKYELKEVEMNPKFADGFFSLPKEVTNIESAGPIMKIW